MTAVAIRTLATDDELLEAAEWCRDRGYWADCQGGCKRTIATCRQAGDLPIYLHSIDGPYCAKCYAPEETDMSSEYVDWTREIDGTPVWCIAEDLKDGGMTWFEVACELRDKHGVNSTEDKVSAAVYYRRKSAGERQADPECPAPPAEEEAPAPAPEAPLIGAETTAVSLEARYADDPAYQLAGVELAAGEAAWAWEAGDREMAFERLDEMRDALRRATVLMRRQEVA